MLGSGGAYKQPRRTADGHPAPPLCRPWAGPTLAAEMEAPPRQAGGSHSPRKRSTRRGLAGEH